MPLKRIDSGPGVELSQVPSTTLETHQQVSQNENGGDDNESNDDSYEYVSDNNLGMLQAAALLTADCLGTGLLALPQDVKVLGKVVGLGFLILNLPINLYAGTILHKAAQYIEDDDSNDDGAKSDDAETATTVTTIGRDGLVRVSKGRKAYSSIASSDDATNTVSSSEKTTTTSEVLATSNDSNDNTTTIPTNDQQQQHPHHDSSTFDYIGLTRELFPSNKHAFRIVLMFYYTNIFLVLGDYILVMSHAVAAMVGESRICLPLAGILASTLMFALSQIKTMANLGRSASIISLACLAIVVVQCLLAHKTTQEEKQDTNAYIPPPESVTLLRQLSSIASIGFAVGSQKLFLNIRHEMKCREKSPNSLGVALTVFGSVYVAICVLAGPNPPSFLFDAIPDGKNRQVAGLLLWIHVAVSYAINSQAICSSMDRLYAHKWTCCMLHNNPKWRWCLLTLILVISSYLVANAVPFFKDLVALIGALTSVPLTLTLPAIFHRQVLQVAIWKPTRHSIPSYALLVFSLAFLILGLTGALGSIELDWSKHGPPFSCF